MTTAGLPHSAISGSPCVCHSPELIAAYRGLHRLRVPRHPPHAFCRLTQSLVCWVRHPATRRPAGTRGPDPRAKRCTRPRRSHPAPDANRACAPSPPEPATRLRGDLHSIDRSDLAVERPVDRSGSRVMLLDAHGAGLASRRHPHPRNRTSPAGSTSHDHYYPPSVVKQQRAAKKNRSARRSAQS